MGSRRPVAVGLVLAGALVLLPSALSGESADPPTPQPCKGTPAGRTGTVKAGTPVPEQICGTRNKDTLTAVGGRDVLWGYHGDDVLRARNGKPDLVWGGPGVDRAVLDACDKQEDVEQEQPGARVCRGVLPRSLAARTQERLPWEPAAIECLKLRSGGYRVRFIEQPRMRAIDTTDAIEWQFVAWRPRLWKWDGAAWARVRWERWLWDLTYDEQVLSFPGNLWRRLDTNEHATVGFDVTEPGSYRVAIRLYWYAGDDVPHRDVRYWVTRHYGPYEDPSQRSCRFPAAPPAAPPPPVAPPPPPPPPD